MKIDVLVDVFVVVDSAPLPPNKGNGYYYKVKSSMLKSLSSGAIQRDINNQRTTLANLVPRSPTARQKRDLVKFDFEHAQWQQGPSTGFAISGLIHLPS